MSASQMLDTRSDIRRFYDRFGRLQDLQRFYEHAAVADLLAHADFEQASAVCEFGCGTGWLARELLSRHLPVQSTYVGLDVSPTMVALSQGRISEWSKRAHVDLVDGFARIGYPDGSFDRFVSTYVFDLLSTDDISSLVEEAHRVLRPGGCACIVSLTFGRSFLQRLITRAWSALWRLCPLLVGGCHPIEASRYFDLPGWRILYRNVVSSWGITSEVVIGQAVLYRKPQQNDRSTGKSTFPASC